MVKGNPSPGFIGVDHHSGRTKLCRVGSGFEVPAHNSTWETEEGGNLYGHITVK